MHYLMKKDGEAIFSGDSEHCFVTNEGKLLRLGDDKFKELHNKLLELME